MDKATDPPVAYRQPIDIQAGGRFLTAPPEAVPLYSIRVRFFWAFIKTDYTSFTNFIHPLAVHGDATKVGSGQRKWGIQALVYSFSTNVWS